MNAGVVRTVGGKGPAKGQCVKVLGHSQIVDCELDLIDTVVDAATADAHI